MDEFKYWLFFGSWETNGEKRGITFENKFYEHEAVHKFNLSDPVDNRHYHSFKGHGSYGRELTKDEVAAIEAKPKEEASAASAAGASATASSGNNVKKG